jgi:G3E family GTPase
VSELWGGRRVPVTLLGGYLGSGKTTLLNELLADADRRYAVLVNDIGAVNVDAALVASRDGDTIELTDGCVCCSLVDGFALAFERLRERSLPPDQVLVELSGVADPARVVSFTGTAGFRLESVMVLFDLDQGLERLADRWSGDTVARQLAGADLIVLTKRDRVDSDAVERVREELAERAPGTPLIVANHGRLPHAWADEFEASLPESLARGDTEPDGHNVANLEVSGDLHPDDLERWLRALPAAVVRVKGLVACSSGLVLVDGVGRRRGVRAFTGNPPRPEAIGTLVVVATGEFDPAQLSVPGSRALA